MAAGAYSAEAERLALAMTRRTLGDGVPLGGYSPARGLANALQHCDPCELEEQSAGQWESMLAAMTNGRRR
jgi:hypothetical protein